MSPMCELSCGGWSGPETPLIFFCLVSLFTALHIFKMCGNGGAWCQHTLLPCLSSLFLLLTASLAAQHALLVVESSTSPAGHACEENLFKVPSHQKICSP